MINFYSPQIPFVLRHKLLFREWLESVADSESCALGDINFIYVSDREILKMNKQFLGHDYYTDVITFPYEQEGGELISGDVYMSIDTIRANAAQYKVKVYNEIARVMVHGLLHLCGYCDGTEAEREIMHAREDLYLRRVPAPCRIW